MDIKHSSGSDQDPDRFHGVKLYVDRLCERYDDAGLPVMLVLALMIGLVGGLGAVGFHHLIGFMKGVFYGSTSTATFMDTVQSLPWYHRLLAPVLGGLIIGPLIHYLVREARGHGVPEVMESVAFRGGRVRFRVAPFKALISAICIGSGGSAGREGPIVQIGASFGSSVGQFFKMNPEKTKTLLCAGAAAGVGGTFNAPMAGVIFGLEVFLRELKFRSVCPIMLAAVVGTKLANTMLGRSGSIFDIPPHTMTGFWELFPYIGLGLVAAVVALVYQKTLYGLEHYFDEHSLPAAIKPAIGGLLLGLLALWIPQIMATGYPVMENALYDRLPLQTVAIFMAAKILATSLTLGSGGSGGIFAPALFIGSMTGSTYGKLMHSWFPGIVAGPTPYAMVGMGAVFAGASHAPVSSVMLLFEMTRDPLMILPLILACTVSAVATRLYQKKNIYTTKLLNRGVDVEAILEEADRAAKDVLEGMRVREAMKPEVPSVSEKTTVRELRETFRDSSHDQVAVVREESGELVGILRSCCILGEWDETRAQSVVAGDIAISSSFGLKEGDDLLDALGSTEGLDLIPVFSDDDHTKLIGVLSREDLLRVVHKRITEFRRIAD